MRHQSAEADGIRAGGGDALVEPQEERQFIAGRVEWNRACAPFARHHGPGAGRVQVDSHEAKRLLRERLFFCPQSEHATSSLWRHVFNVSEKFGGPDTLKNATPY